MPSSSGRHVSVSDISFDNLAFKEMVSAISLGNMVFVLAFALRLISMINFVWNQERSCGFRRVVRIYLKVS